jgi:hypothetical protein
MASIQSSDGSSSGSSVGRKHGVVKHPLAGAACDDGAPQRDLVEASLDHDDAAGHCTSLDPELREQLVIFETFFKTFGFKRILGRVWGLLVLSGQPLSSKEVMAELGISQGAASTTLNELQEWGAVQATFDNARRCHLHEAVGNTLSIVATVLRRREQVAFEQFRVGATRAMDFVVERHGSRDPRALTLRSIIATCDLASAMMNVIFSSVSSALGDPQSLLSKAVNAALKVGVGRLVKNGAGNLARLHAGEAPADESADQQKAPSDV